MHRILQGIVTLLISASVYSRQCSNVRVVPRYEEKFNVMNSGDIIVEARYRLKKESFQVIRVWNEDDDSINMKDQIKVHSVDPCFNELSNERYLLVVRKDGDGFSSDLPPLPLKKSTKRRSIWNAWCEASPDSCRLSIPRASFSPLIIFEYGEMIYVECHAFSKYPLSDIRWKKDGIDIREGKGNIFAKNDIFMGSINREEGRRSLIITSGSPIQNGLYSCVARDENGDDVEMKTRITLRGTDDGIQSCPEGAEHFCLFGTCHGIQGIPGEVSCLCPQGYSGERCESLEILNPVGSQNDQTETIEELEHTVVILSIVAILTGICFIIALISLCRTRRRRRSASDYETPTENDKTADTDIETASENLDKV